MWNLSNRIAAWGACACAALRNGFHMSHHRQTNAAALFLAQPGIELAHAGFGAIFAPEPDRAPTIEIADDDAIGVTLPDRNLVDADPFGRRRSGPRQLRLHVLLVQRFDGVPAQMQLFRHFRNRRRAAASADIKSEALGVERIVRQEIECFGFHSLASPAFYAADLELQEDPERSTRQIAHLPRSSVVPAVVHSAAGAASRFFERRSSVITRASGSPNRPRNSSRGRKPAKRYASSRRFFFEATIPAQWADSPPSPIAAKTTMQQRLTRFSSGQTAHTIPGRAEKFLPGSPDRGCKNPAFRTEL